MLTRSSVVAAADRAATPSSNCQIEPEGVVDAIEGKHNRIKGGAHQGNRPRHGSQTNVKQVVNHRPSLG